MSFRDRIKRILKIALPVIAVLFVAYHMLFYTVKMTRDETKELEEDYGEYILYSAREFAWYIDQLPLPKFRFRMFPQWSIKKTWKKEVVLFRWNANDLKKKMKSELRQELEELKQKYPVVTDYIYDEDNFIVDVYMDESKGEYYYEIYNYMNSHIKDKFLLINSFCQEDNFFSHKQYGEFEIHDIENDKEDETNVEDVYAENEQKALEEILSRRKQERPVDLKDWRGAEWKKDERIFYLTKLDLSSYDDITGELDLSGFTKLRYVCLENTKADKVILPESLEYIDSKSFRTCMNLEEIVIPASVEKIYGPIFWGCKNLKKVTFEGDAPEVENEQRNVFGKVSDDFKIYHRTSSEGWEKRCWVDYEVVEIE